VRCFVKLENLQMTGSFKERGAANLLLQLERTERARGVAAASAGNHGLAVAFHAARLGIGAVIVMPESAPLIKVTSARRYGAEVILAGANYDEAYARARELAERGLAFVHPFDDARVVAGQGTLGLLNRTLGLGGRNVVLVLSGGNIDVTMLARIIERGLVKDGRLVRLGVILRDQPGALARLTALVAECRANILNIEHDRAFSRAAIGESKVELTLETSGREQIDTLKQRLVDGGYGVEERRA
jgi:threonine dehydratase